MGTEKERERREKVTPEYAHIYTYIYIYIYYACMHTDMLNKCNSIPENAGQGNLKKRNIYFLIKKKWRGVENII